MKIKKKYNSNILGIIQYGIALTLTLLLFFSLIPFVYNDTYQFIISLILIQIIISIIRLRFLNIIFETILFFLALIITIPMLIKIQLIAIPLSIILYVFKIIAALIAALDLSTFNSNFVYKKVEIYKTKREVKNPKKMKNKSYQDAEFKEK